MFFVFVFGLTVPMVAITHVYQVKESAAKVATYTVVNGDTIALNGRANNLNKINNSKINKPFVLDITKELTDHLHNKIVHFPIALGTLAFLLTLLDFKEKKFEKAIIITVGLGFIFSMLAFLLFHSSNPGS